MKTLRNKKFSVLLSVLAIICLMTSALFFGTFSAKADAMPSITMEEGASARVAGDDVNGLRFIASISNQEYGWFSENVGADKTYASVKFGMLIAPAEYLDHADFNKANVFGIGENGESVTPVYAWATYANGEWNYDEVANADKVRIINIVAGQMQNYKDNVGVNKMAIIGSIVDYQSYNIVREFVGRGYYQLLDSNGNIVETVFASHKDEVVDNNVRSMIEVVQTSIENGVLDEDQINSAKETYFDTIKDNVTVEVDNNDLLLTKTVAGNDYNGEKTSVDLTNAVYTANGISTEFKLGGWKTESANLAVNNGVVTALKQCKGSIVTSEYFDNISISFDVYKPIASKMDLDTLGFAYANNKAELWHAGNYYMLANDIDYATDVSEEEVNEEDNGHRMTDDNSDADLWDRYLIPIAPNYQGFDRTSSRKLVDTDLYGGTYEWGIFGALNSGDSSGATNFFKAVLDGAGYAIKNAVIPYGTIFSYHEISTNHGQNFIGTLAYGGQLRNIAFVGLEFEDPMQIGTAAASATPNPYYTDANENNNDTSLKENGYITQTKVNGGWGYKYYNASNKVGLVGSIGNAIISNVYVDAAMKSGTYNPVSTNGLIVAKIDKDSDSSAIKSKVENCIVKTSYYSKIEWIDYLDGSFNAGMGAIVGASYLTDATAINNCFVIGSNLQVFSAGDASDLHTITTIFAPAARGGENLCSNFGIYNDVASLKADTAQASVLANISIAKYLG